MSSPVCPGSTTMSTSPSPGPAKSVASLGVNRPDDHRRQHAVRRRSRRPPTSTIASSEDAASGGCCGAAGGAGGGRGGGGASGGGSPKIVSVKSCCWRHGLVSFVRGLRRPGPTRSPGGAPVLRSRSRAVCRISTAAAWSTTARCRLPATPLSRSVRCASTLVRRSSTRRTQTGAMRAATTAAYLRARAAAGPSSPESDRGSPTTTPTAACSMHQRGDRLDVGVAGGRLALGGAGHGRHRRREDAVGVAQRRPRRAPMPTSTPRRAPRSRGVRHQPASSPTRHSTAASASPTFDASWPPPWAMSSLPPPPPPRAVAATRTSSPARMPRAARRLVGGHDDDRAALGRAGDRDDARAARRRAGRAGRAPACARRRRRPRPRRDRGRSPR